jgi:c-di-GMP-binding flagellar brake protein YcgR
MVVVPVRTTNISQGGFLCLTNAALELGSVLHVRVQLSPHESLDCRAQVARVEDVPDQDPPTSAVLVAFRFVDLGDTREMQLQRALVELGADLDAAGVPNAYRSR